MKLSLGRYCFCWYVLSNYLMRKSMHRSGRCTMLNCHCADLILNRGSQQRLNMFTRVRTIKGRRYLYEEHRWREGGKVRSKSICLGRADQTPRLQNRREKKARRGLLGVAWTATFQTQPGAKAMQEWEVRTNEASKAERAKQAEFKAQEAVRAREERATKLDDVDRRQLEQAATVAPTSPAPSSPEQAQPSEPAPDAAPASSNGL